MTVKPLIYTKVADSDPALVAAAAEAGVADLHEALGAVAGRMLLMDPRMRPLSMKMRVAGPAVTAFNYPGDNLMMHQALYLAGKGHAVSAVELAGRNVGIMREQPGFLSAGNHLLFRAVKA